MPPKLYYHPLASFCWKALIPLYENGTEFEPIVVDLMDEASAAAFRAVWPLAKFPVLVDEKRGHTVAESTVVIEYLDAHFPGAVRFIPEDADLAWQARMWDRVLDSYVHEQMQKIVTDRLRPAGGNDPAGVDMARRQLRQSYDILERHMAGREWVVGDSFGLADCAASPALFYANTVEPFDATHPELTTYLGRLMRRPAFARVLKEAEPWFRNFPLERKPDVNPPVFADSRRTST
jgi:glutathione S-transferase